ncbi:hypothetical protein GCM10017752_36630 [Streptomyces roseoviridis]
MASGPQKRGTVMRSLDHAPDTAPPGIRQRVNFRKVDNSARSSHHVRSRPAALTSAATPRSALAREQPTLSRTKPGVP